MWKSTIKPFKYYIFRFFFSEMGALLEKVAPMIDNWGVSEYICHCPTVLLSESRKICGNPYALFWILKNCAFHISLWGGFTSQKVPLPYRYMCITLFWITSKIVPLGHTKLLGLERPLNDSGVIGSKVLEYDIYLHTD